MGDFLKKLFQAAFPAEQSSDGTSPIGSAESVLKRASGLLKPVTSAYRQRYRQYGAEPQGVYWSNADNVRKRFEVLCAVFDPADIALGEASINDLGCGYGALYDVLKTHPIMRGGTYHGYDICESLLDACHTRIRDPRAEFHHAMRATHNADYALVSGTFNMKINADDGQWLAYVLASLQALWEKTDKAMAFNMLDRELEQDYDGLYYADARVFEGFCRAHLSDKVEVITDYGLPDFTIYVRR